ncbi:MAG: iron-containing alcohol dehydrogenase, partial [Alphaproteobacteria bacterium]|nr:iron-containing alcohol dehydrogenase [Alphaproteobacteria bacterium]
MQKSNPKLQPETLIYDPELVTALPPALAATSGMNAIAHAVEGFMPLMETSSYPSSLKRALLPSP